MEITLKQLVQIDAATASIKASDCRFIALCLMMLQKWYIRPFLPRKIKENMLNLQMLAATLGRTPEEREPAFQESIRLQMVREGII